MTKIPTYPFGRTGHHSTRTLFGGFALSSCSQAKADEVLELVLAYGINHIDTAASYGRSEERLKSWLTKHRDHFFLATKTEQRTYKGAWAELEQSRQRMGVDTIDLWQMHLLVEEDAWQTAFSPDGALKAFLEAREKGIVRYLGVTGHGVQVARMHLRSLAQHDFDSVLLPYNYSMMQNPQYAADFAELEQFCLKHNVAMQTIKAVARGHWGSKKANRNTWYEPLEAQDAIDTAVAYTLNRPHLFLNTVGDPDLLPKVLDAASRFRPQPQAELDAKMAALQTTPMFA